MVIIAMLAIMLGEGYLVDICIIYAMIRYLQKLTGPCPLQMTHPDNVPYKYYPLEGGERWQ